MITFNHVYASYSPQVPILKDVSFTVNNGDFVAFVGTNGAGKSTTMRLMNGLLKPESGEVLVDGVPTTMLKTSEIARKVGYLFQNPDHQICCNTVYEELMFGFEALGVQNQDAKNRVNAIIEQFGFKPDDDPFLLNRGTRQLLALASIIVMDHETVILDEPTTGLDYRECLKVMDIVKRLHEQGTTVVMVCHDMEIVADYAKRVVVMTHGTVVADGKTFNVLRNPEVLAKADLIPPQATAISMGLLEAVPGIAGSAISTANTIEELELAICAHADAAYKGQGE